MPVRVLSVSLVAATITGCSSSSPQPVPPPVVDRAGTTMPAPEEPDVRGPRVWTIENSVRATVKVDSDGSVYIIVSNRAPRAVVNLQLGCLGADHIILMPPIPSGKTVQKKIDDLEMVNAARAGTLPPLSFFEGDFER